MLHGPCGAAATADHWPGGFTLSLDAAIGVLPSAAGMVALRHALARKAHAPTTRALRHTLACKARAPTTRALRHTLA